MNLHICKSKREWYQMSNQKIISSTSIVLLVIGLLIGLGGSYFLLKTSQQQKFTDLENEISELKYENLAIKQTILSLENEISNYQDRLLNLTDIIQRLGGDIENLKKNVNASREVDIHNLYNKSYKVDEDFENISIGSIPSRWHQISGTRFDNVSVQDDHSYSPTKSIKLHENGHDGYHCKIRIDVNATSNLLLDMRFMISGEPNDIAVFKLLNETGNRIVSMNCLIDYHWGYYSSSGWIAIENIPAPIADRWYHVQILADKELQKARYLVGGYDSGWLETYRSWEELRYVEFRGNEKFPADSWYDDIKIVEYQQELPPS